MRKLLFLLCLLLVLPIGLMAADKVPTLVVLTKDKANHEFKLTEKPQVKFEGTNLQVVSEKTTATFALSDIIRFTYVNLDPSGIDELEAEPSAPGISYGEGTLTVSQLAEGATVSVYTVDGKLVQQLKAHHAGTFRLNLSQLPFGVYLVKAGNTTYKITKR